MEWDTPCEDEWQGPHPDPHVPMCVVQSLSRVWLVAIPRNAASQAPLCFTISPSLLRFTSIESVTLSNHHALCCPLLEGRRAFSLSHHQGLFWWVSSSHQVAKVLEFQLQHQSFQNEYRGLISFSMDRCDLFAVQGTLKRLLQHHNSKASILQHSTSFIVQLSHLYMTTGKTIVLTSMDFCSQSDVSVF